MSVEELSREQFEELKWDYYYELLYEEPERELTCPDDISDEETCMRFAGVIFSSDDFACTAGQY